MKKSFLTAIIVFFTLPVLLAACISGGTFPVKFTISFDIGSASGTVEAISEYEGAEISAPDDPVRGGYEFGGWYLDGERFVFDLMPAKSITLTAKWKKIYTVYFESGEGGSHVPPIMAVAGTKITAPAAPEREGYAFSGWQTEEGGDYSFDTMPSENTVLIAKWLEAVGIRFDTGVEGLTVPPLYALAGTAVTAPKDPVRAGHHFKGWLLGGNLYVFSVMPSSDITLTADWQTLTNLPALFIDLENSYPLESVNRDIYIKSSVSLENTGVFSEIKKEQSEFRGRGNGSWDEAKKGYRIKFASKQSLLGNPPSRHWVILPCTNFDDRTLSKNKTAFTMAKELFTNIEYSTSAEWVDVYINGVYRGVYVLCEQVRVDEDRVNIDSQYGVLDTGYLLEYDSYAKGREGIDYFRISGLKYPFTVKSPDPEEFAEEGVSASEYRAQISYIKNYMSNLVSAALSGSYTTFSQYADTDSFVDMYILHELFKNTDTGWSSFFLYKKPGGKVFAGPPWDFDATAGSSRGESGATGIYVAGTIMSHSDHTASELYISLYKKPEFRAAVTARWRELASGIKTFTSIFLSDAVIETNKSAMGANFRLWKGESQAVAEANWSSFMKSLRLWLFSRANWLDTEWK